jgi:gentisate 1,2-dioxygenase
MAGTAQEQARRTAQEQARPDTHAIRAEYYHRIGRADLAPLWEVMKSLVPPTPVTCVAPYLWRASETWPLVREAGQLITAKEAERRVLVLENPGFKGKSRITQTLYAGIQLILPGETAPAHRHTASAIRFVLDGEGAFTAVDGEKAVMRRGDFVITPSWTYHDHGNPSAGPMMWLDVLDAPMVNFFDAAFSEHLDAEVQPTARADGDSYARYGSGVLPVAGPVPDLRSPIINYPYERTRPVVERMLRAGDVEPSHGARVRYANPMNGGWATPTMGPCLSMLPPGFSGQPYRSTDATVFLCVEGEGATRIAGKDFHWIPGDVFVAPSWTEYRHTSEAQSVLFSISDRPAQQALGIWRERRDEA